MSPPPKKRRTTRATAHEAQDHAAEDHAAQVGASSTAPLQEAAPDATSEPTSSDDPQDPASAAPASASLPSSSSSSSSAAAAAQDRMARFKALQARAKNSTETNLKEATRESQRLAADPGQLTALHRKHAIASHKLLKADVEEAGEDFERKRAWDWTVDESEKWDRRLRKKAAHRDKNAFQDYAQESNKVYKRQLQNINPDMESYVKDKMAAIERAAAAGGLDIVETEDGEMIAVDRDGSFYTTADSTSSFGQSRPDKAAVDRLVADLRRAEEQTLKKRRERMAKNGDDGDVTHINEKNKQFNQKLARFYNKYTAEIRDSFERGTMI